MECRITSFKGPRPGTARATRSAAVRSAGFTLVELMVSSLVGAFLLATLAYVFFFSNRSFASVTNYLDLDQKTQATLDKMSREIRTMKALNSCSSNSISFQDWDVGTIQYTYDASAKSLTRTTTNSSDLYLTSCDSLKFAAFNRAPNGTNFVPVTTTNLAGTKAIELTWNCSRTILSAKANTECMQSAIIVIRAK